MQVCQIWTSLLLYFLLKFKFNEDLLGWLVAGAGKERNDDDKTYWICFQEEIDFVLSFT